MRALPEGDRIRDVPDHDARARGARGDVFADRAERPAGQRRVAAGSDDEQVGPLGGGDQDLGRMPRVTVPVTLPASSPDATCSASASAARALPAQSMSSDPNSIPDVLGWSQLITASTAAPVRSACPAAHRSASTEAGDPSTPTTIRGGASFRARFPRRRRGNRGGRPPRLRTIVDCAAGCRSDPAGGSRCGDDVRSTVAGSRIMSCPL